MKESLKRAQARYQSKFIQFHMKLNKEKDVDVIEWIRQQGSASASIKALIRSNISRKSK